MVNKDLSRRRLGYRRRRQSEGKKHAGNGTDNVAGYFSIATSRCRDRDESSSRDNRYDVRIDMMLAIVGHGRFRTRLEDSRQIPAGRQ